MTPEVRAYLDKIASPTRRRDAETLVESIGRITGEEPRMWGSIVAFGEYHYRYASGREGDAPAAAFAARKAALTFYLPEGVGAHADLLSRLGPHKTGVGCLYVKALGDVDVDVLEAIVAKSYATVTAGMFPHRARESAERPEPPEPGAVGGRPDGGGA
ncbi:MAG TPA: DUF1801 domain-containing protein [Actinomycetes bacterium]|nr:DUF1801 domain-containing protein [Actinomycetes bacterium]